MFVDYMPYYCQLCNANFAQKSHLKLHLDSHHAYVELDETRKPFVCKTCDRGFLFIISLQRHLLQHCKLSPKSMLAFINIIFVQSYCHAKSVKKTLLIKVN